MSVGFRMMVLLCAGVSVVARSDDSLDSLLASESKNPQVLNFDADVILGEKMAPDVMFRRASDSLEFETMLHSRDNFNDFLRGDFKRVPDLVE